MVIEKPEDIEIKLRNSQDSLKSVPWCTLNYARSTEVIIPLSNTVIHSSVSADCSLLFRVSKMVFLILQHVCDNEQEAPDNNNVRPSLYDYIIDISQGCRTWTPTMIN